MINQQTDNKLSKLKKSKDLTYDKCYNILKEYFIEQNTYFKNSDIINEGKVETLGNLCEIEKKLKINIWNEDLVGLKTINDLALLVLHELLYNKTII